MRHLFRFIAILFAYLTFITLPLFAQDINVSISPNPVLAGDRVRISLLTEIPLRTASLQLPNTRTISLNQIDNTLFSTNYEVDSESPSKKIQGRLTIVTNKNQPVDIPIEFEVIAQKDISKLGGKEFNKNQNSELNAQHELNLKIDELQNSLDSLQKDRKDLLDQIKKLQNEIGNLKKEDRDRASLEQKQKLLANLEKQLQEKQDALNVKAQELRKKILDLSRFERSLQQKEQELTQKESTLKQEKEQVQELKTTLSEKQEKLAEKETQLASLSEELSSQNLQIQILTSKLGVEEQRLQSERDSLVEEKQSLQQQQVLVSKEKDNLTEERDTLLQASKQLESREKYFETMKKNEQELFLAQKRNLENRWLELKEKQEKQQLKEIHISDSLAFLEKQKEILNAKEEEIKESKTYIESLQSDLDAKYNSLQELKAWLELKNKSLQASYQEQRSERFEDEAVFEAQFKQLENLTAVLKQRGEQLQSINKELQARNQQLLAEIKAMSEPDYRYSLTPYVGLYRFKPKRDYLIGTQAGLNLSSVLRDNVNLNLGLGVIAAIKSGSSKSGDLLNSFSADVSYDLWMNPKTALVFSGGIMGDFKENGVNLDLGIGSKHVSSKNFNSIMGVRLGEVMSFFIGFERKIRFERLGGALADSTVPDRSKTSLSKIIHDEIKDTPAPTPVEKKPDPLKMMMMVPSVVENYQFEMQYYRDIFKHWARRDIEKLSQVGLVFGPTDSKLETSLSMYEARVHKLDMFDPKAPVTVVEASRLLVQSLSLPKVFSNLVVPVDFEISGNPSETFNVTVSLLNEHGEMVRSIAQKTDVKNGFLQVDWDVFATQNATLNSGIYNVLSTVTSNVGRTTSVQQPFSIQTSFFIVPNVSTSMDVNIENLDVSSWAYPFVITALSERILVENKDGILDLNAPLTRAQFMSSVSRVIRKLGGKIGVMPDLSLYTDYATIDPEIRDDIALYISELGYGGDTKKQLRPNETISRAEAAVILSRLVTWVRLQSRGLPTSITR